MKFLVFFCQVHNVSEQYRRKYLKSCFDNLQREVVTEANPKASHLLILTSALDVVQQVKDKHGQLKRDHERLLEEQRSLDQRLEEVIRDLHIADPGFDVDQVLAQLDCGNGPESTLIGGVDRPDLFQLEETVLAFHSRGKRPLADVIDHNELENIRERKYSKAPQGGRKTTKRNKKQGNFPFLYSNDLRNTLSDVQLITRLIDWLIEWSIDWLIDWWLDWWLDWLIEWLIEWLIDRLIEWLIDWMIECTMLWSFCLIFLFPSAL